MDEKAMKIQMIQKLLEDLMKMGGEQLKGDKESPAEMVIGESPEEESSESLEFEAKEDSMDLEEEPAKKKNYFTRA
jgi:hypothetical protein